MPEPKIPEPLKTISATPNAIAREVVEQLSARFDALMMSHAKILQAIEHLASLHRTLTAEVERNAKRIDDHETRIATLERREKLRRGLRTR